jgi:hypothetical protein
MGDVEKIIPSAVPESDLNLATQMQELIFSVSGINLENWSGQDDKQISSLTLLLKQAANLMVFQKYFDQWDHALKLLGERLLQIALNNWNEAKVGLLIGEQPSPHFYSKIFAKYQTVVEEGLLTPTQRNLQAQSMMDINSAFGREVLPASMIIKDMNIQGKAQIMEYLQKQEEQASQMQQAQMEVQHAFEHAKLQELMSKAASNIATARERHGRSESNIGLFEERLSMITKNHALAAKEKMAALAQLLETIQKFGEVETFLQQNNLDSIEYQQEQVEDRDKEDAKRTAESNKFVEALMGQMGQQGQQDNNQSREQMV